MYSAVVRMTAPQAAKQWVAYVSDTMQFLVLYELDATVAGPLLTAHITHMLAWLLCLYYFNANGTATAAIHTRQTARGTATNYDRITMQPQQQAI